MLVLLLVTFGATIYQVLYKPYRSRSGVSNNICKLELFNTVALYVILVSQLPFTLGGLPDEEMAGWIVVSILFTILLVNLFNLLSSALSSVRLSRRRKAYRKMINAQIREKQRQRKLNRDFKKMMK